MVVATSHVAEDCTHHDTHKDFIPYSLASSFDTHPSFVVYYKAFPHVLAKLHSCHVHSATLQGIAITQFSAHIAHESALRPCIVTCHTPTYCTFVHLYICTHKHAHATHIHTHIHAYTHAPTHTCMHLCTHTQKHTHTHTDYL